MQGGTHAPDHHTTQNTYNRRLRDGQLRVEGVGAGGRQALVRRERRVRPRLQEEGRRGGRWALLLPLSLLLLLLLLLLLGRRQEQGPLPRGVEVGGVCGRGQAAEVFGVGVAEGDGPGEGGEHACVCVFLFCFGREGWVYEQDESFIERLLDLAS